MRIAKKSPMRRPLKIPPTRVKLFGDLAKLAENFLVLTTEDAKCAEISFLCPTPQITIRIPNFEKTKERNDALDAFT